MTFRTQKIVMSYGPVKKKKIPQNGPVPGSGPMGVVARAKKVVMNEPARRSSRNAAQLRDIVIVNAPGHGLHEAFRVKVGDTYVLYNMNDSGGDKMAKDGFHVMPYIDDYRPFLGRSEQILCRDPRGDCRPITHGISRWWYSGHESVKSDLFDRMDQLNTVVRGVKSADELVRRLREYDTEMPPRIDE